jgi:hypothetical protein
MLQQLPTTHLATIQRALDLYQQGRGPHLLGSFLGKGSTELVAIRQGSGKYLERRSSNGELTRRRKAWFAQEK